MVTPTPRAKGSGNLPDRDEPDYDDSRGREVRSRNVEDYERVDPRSFNAIPPTISKWADPPRPPDMANAVDVREPSYQGQRESWAGVGSRGSQPVYGAGTGFGTGAGSARRQITEADYQDQPTEPYKVPPELANNPLIHIRIDYENKYHNAQNAQERYAAWTEYKGRVRQLDPNATFFDDRTTDYPQEDYQPTQRGQLPGPFPPRPDAPSGQRRYPDTSVTTLFDANGNRVQPELREPTANQRFPPASVTLAPDDYRNRGYSEEDYRPSARERTANERSPPYQYTSAPDDYARLGYDPMQPPQQGPAGGADVDPTQSGVPSAPREPYTPTQYSEEDYQPSGRGPASPSRQGEYGPAWQSRAPQSAINTRPPQPPDPRDKAFDPRTQQLDPRSGYSIDPSGRVSPLAGGGGGAGGTGGPTARTPRPPVTEPMGGYGMNPQGSNAQVGFSTNNAANDMTHIMQAAKDFAGHTFHLNQNDEHSAGGYHALMAGHGAAPINIIDQGFKKIDPAGQMPNNIKIEKLAEGVFDYHVQRGQPEQAAKSAFEVAQFGNVMAKQHGKRAADMLQQGNIQGAATELVGGYNWLVDGHTADYDPRANQIILRDAKTGQQTGSLPVTPQLVEHLTMGMMSGELNWDIMKGRGQAVMAGGQPPPQQTRPAVQPPAADAGPTFTTPPAVTPEQGGGENTEPTQTPRPNTGAVDTSPPPQLAQAQKPSYSAADMMLRKETNQVKPQPTQPDTTRQSPSKRVVEGGGEQQKTEPMDEGPYKMPVDEHGQPRVIRRESPQLGRRPDFDTARAQVNQWLKDEIADINQRAKKLQSGKGIQDKSLQAQAIANAKAEAQRAIAELRDREREWDNKERSYDQQESQRVRNWETRTDSVRDKLADDYEKQNADLRTKYDTVKDHDEMARKIKAGEIRTNDDEVAANNWMKVRNSPLRYMATPDDRKPLNALATKILRKNPEMDPDEAMAHAITFTSIVSKGSTGVNGKEGKNAREFTPIGTNPFGGIVVQNRGGDKVHIDEKILHDIEVLHQANSQQFSRADKEHKKTVTKQQQQHADTSWGQTEQFLKRAARRIGPMIAPAREAGRLLNE